MSLSAVSTTRRPGYWQLILPYWRSEKKWLGSALLALWIGTTFYMTKANVHLAQLAGQLTDMLLTRDWPRIWPVLVATLGFGVLVSLLMVVNYFTNQALQFSWRSWMTADFLDRWTAHQAFYGIEREGLVDNADQRMAEDINDFTTKLLSMALGLVLCVTSAWMFGVMLWQLSGILPLHVGAHVFVVHGYLVWIVVAYVLTELALSHFLGHTLASLTMQNKHVEADFRYRAMQVRENAEQIAFYDGGGNERLRLAERWQWIFTNWRSLQLQTAKVMFGNGAYGQLGLVLPTLAAMPRYLSGQIKLGGLTQVAMAFAQFRGALSFFNQAYVVFAQWRAVGNRLRDLAGAIADVDSQRLQVGSRLQVAQGGSHVEMGEVTLHDPDGVVLSRLSPLNIQVGERWLLRGPSGAGKSTLLRAMAGLWPYGEGKIAVPHRSRMMFVPQRSYLPEGTLKAALCYPALAEQYDDAGCRQVLMECGLGDYADALHEHDRWQQRLSGGEQQRMAFARVLLQRPDFVFLDEASSALDEPTERLLYTLLFEKLSQSALISVAHRGSVAELHTRVYQVLPGDGCLVGMS